MAALRHWAIHASCAARSIVTECSAAEAEMPRLALTLLGRFQARLGPGAPLALPAKVQPLLACAPASPAPVTR
jgi:hypothetical protein